MKISKERIVLLPQFTTAVREAEGGGGGVCVCVGGGGGGLVINDWRDPLLIIINHSLTTDYLTWSWHCATDRTYDTQEQASFFYETTCILFLHPADDEIMENMPLGMAPGSASKTEKT